MRVEIRDRQGKTIGTIDGTKPEIATAEYVMWQGKVYKFRHNSVGRSINAVHFFEFCTPLVLTDTDVEPVKS